MPTRELCEKMLQVALKEAQTGRVEGGIPIGAALFTQQGELISRGLPEGPIVARTLRQIEDRWVEAGFPTGEVLEGIVSDALAVRAR